MKLPSGFKKMVETNAMSVATTDGRGKPHAIAVAYVKLREGKLVITDNFMKKTVKHIQKRPDVAVAVWNSKWKGYEVKGKARYYASGKWYNIVKRMKENKGYACKGAVVITPMSIKKLG